MSLEQKEFLRDFVKTTQNIVSGLVASVQIGGGCVLCKSSNAPNVFLDPVDIIQAFCLAVSSSKTHTDPEIHRGLCNIVVQRVGGVVHLNRATMHSISCFISAPQQCVLMSAPRQEPCR